MGVIGGAEREERREEEEREMKRVSIGGFCLNEIGF